MLSWYNAIWQQLHVIHKKCRTKPCSLSSAVTMFGNHGCFYSSKKHYLIITALALRFRCIPVHLLYVLNLNKCDDDDLSTKLTEALTLSSARPPFSNEVTITLPPVWLKHTTAQGKRHRFYSRVISRDLKDKDSSCDNVQKHTKTICVEDLGRIPISHKFLQY